MNSISSVLINNCLAIINYNIDEIKYHLNFRVSIKMFYIISKKLVVINVRTKIKHCKTILMVY